MKNGWNKKIIIISGLVMVLFLTAFLPWNMPNLINADKPFIDLSGSIGESIGNANKAYEKAVLTPAPDDDPVPTVTPIPDDITDITDPDNQELKIVIGDEDYSGSGEAVYINGERLNVNDSFTIQGDMDELKVILIDNYAESGTLGRLKKALEDSGIDYSISYVD